MRGSDARTHMVANSSASTLIRNQKIGMSHMLTRLVRRQEPEQRARRSAEEQRHRDRRHRDDVHELGEEEDRETDTGVLGVEAADELLFGLDEVERRMVHLCASPR